MDTTRLTARAVRSGGWWAIDVVEVAGLHTQARRLDQVEAMVLDAATLLTGRPEEQFAVTVVPALPEADQQVVQTARARSGALAAAERAAAQASRTAVARLREDGLTVRDVAAIMGISPQRVSQLAAH